MRTWENLTTTIDKRIYPSQQFQNNFAGQTRVSLEQRGMSSHHGNDIPGSTRRCSVIQPCEAARSLKIKTHLSTTRTTHLAGSSRNEGFAVGGRHTEQEGKSCVINVMVGRHIEQASSNRKVRLPVGSLRSTSPHVHRSSDAS